MSLDEADTYRALIAAADRRHEVLSELDASASVDDAAHRISALLQIEPDAALAVLDLQLRRLIPTERAKLQTALEESRPS